MDLECVLVATLRTTATMRAEESDVRVARSSGGVPLAWALLFAPEDVADGTAFSPVNTALARFRERAEVLRSVAGANANSITTLEAAIVAAGPGASVQLFVDSAQNAATSDALRAIFESTTAKDVAQWGAALESAGASLARGMLTKRLQGKTVASAIAGFVERTVVVKKKSTRHVPELSWAWAPPEGASALSLRLGEVDRSMEQQDTLTALLLVDAKWGPAQAAAFARAYVRIVRPTLAAYEGMQRSERVAHDDLALREQATLAADNVVNGRADPFAPLRGVPRGSAAHALSQLIGLPRRELLKALRVMEEPLAAALCEAVGYDHCPAAERVALLEWCSGGAPPWRAKSREAMLACRIAALGDDAMPLSKSDPLAVIERLCSNALYLLIDSNEVPPLLRPIVIARALSLRESAVKAMLYRERRAQHSDNAASPQSLLPTLLAWCANTARTIDEAPRAWLLSRAKESPEGALIVGLDRAILRIALGDASELERVLEAFAPDSERASAVVAAIASGACAKSAIPWLQRAAERDADAAIVLLAADEAATSRATALRTLSALPERVKRAREGFAEGLITTGEQDIVLAQGEHTVAALEKTGADGALLAAVRAAIDAEP